MLLASLFFALAQITAKAQIGDFFPGELYFKLEDTFSIALDKYPADSVNIPEQMPFFASFAGVFQVSSVKRVFYFTGDPALGRTFRVRCAESINLDIFVAELAAQPEVEYAEKIPASIADYTPDDLGANLPQGQWGLYKIDAQSAWNLSFGSPSVVVAIVDNAIQTNHPDLTVLPGWDEADQDNDPNPPATNCDHGTHVAGISGATTDNGLGVSSIGFGVSILPVKVSYDVLYNGCSMFIHKGYEGIAWAASNGAHIINCSWGGSTYTLTGQNTVTFAWNSGAVVVAAAGNNSSPNPFYPAAFNHVVSVAATDINDQKPWWSNYGSAVDVSAPGWNIRSLSLIPTNGYGQKNGTSMAAPMVSGLLGLMLSANPALSNADLVNCLLSSTDNIDAQNPGLIGQLGAGRINAFKAVQCAKQSGACPPAWTFVSPADDLPGGYHAFEASQNITAVNKVTGNATVTYDAGVFVKLQAGTSNPGGGFKAQTSGFFKAIIDGCGGIVNVDDPVEPPSLSVRVFPNPSAGAFNVMLPDGLPAGATVRLLSLTGQILQELQAEPGAVVQPVRAENLPPGLYLIQLAAKGGVLATGKVVLCRQN